MNKFNLTDEKWIPCLMSENSAEIKPQMRSLREIFYEAGNIKEISGETPLVTIALHRLLIAILHRALNTPRDADEWAEIWREGEFENQKIEEYFDAQKHRFNLFDPERPFYQNASLREHEGKSKSPILFYFQGESPATLFDHTNEHQPLNLKPPEAIRLLLAFHLFDVGGTKTAEKDKDFAYASPLIQSAVALVRGKNLFETLMLNLHRSDPEDDTPWTFDTAEDLPSWELSHETESRDRLPKGYIDFLTWQSRRVILFPIHNEDGDIVVNKVLVMKGFQIPDNFRREEKELFVPFRALPKAKKNQSPWVSIRFEEEKALWRDSLALLQSIDGKQIRPKILSWLGDLVSSEILRNEDTISMSFYGFTVDQAKPLFWRQETFLLPLAYLENPKLVALLGEVLTLAEKVGDSKHIEGEKSGGILNEGLRRLAYVLVKPNADEGIKPKEENIAPILKRLDAGSLYWSRLEPSFKSLMVNLPKDKTSDDDGKEIFGRSQLKIWAKIVVETAQKAFDSAVNSLSGSARELKAVAEAEKEFYGKLRNLKAENPHLFDIKNKTEVK